MTRSAWMRSNGGPMLCSSPAIARLWRGMRDSSIGARASDFDRACRGAELIAPIACGAGQALLLGGPPWRSALHTGPEGVTIFRRISCVLDDDALADVCAALPSRLPPIARPFRFDLKHLDLLLYDAGAAPVPTLYGRVEMRAAAFQVSSHRYARARQFDLVVHRLVRLAE